MRTLLTGVFSCAHVLAVGAAWAQTSYPIESEVRFEVWNGSQWSTSVQALPGDRIEWRVVASYTGPRTDIKGLGELLYQPVISNTDNTGPIMDQVGPWRNGGVGSEALPGTLLTSSEAADGNALASYGRYGLGFIGTVPTSSNVLTTFRHSGGANGAPPGDWLRLAGTFVSQWPVAGDAANWTSTDGNRLLRGVVASQASRIANWYPDTGNVNPYYRSETANVVLMRQALILGDSTDVRSLEITTMQQMLRRTGMTTGTTDNARYMTWYTQDNQSFSAAYKTGVVITPAVVTVVPAPAAGVVACVAVFCRRRAWAGSAVARR